MCDIVWMSPHVAHFFVTATILTKFITTAKGEGTRIQGAGSLKLKL